MVGLFPIFTHVWTVNLKTWFGKINQNILIKCHFYILYAVEMRHFIFFCSGIQYEHIEVESVCFV